MFVAEILHRHKATFSLRTEGGRPGLTWSSGTTEAVSVENLVPVLPDSLIAEPAYVGGHGEGRTGV